MSANPRQDLLNAIAQALGSIPPSLNAGSPGSDVYELYIFSLIVQAAAELGAMIHYEDVHGASPSVFVARTSPGFIYSTEHPYTHAVIEFPNRPPLEAHLGIRVVGTSGVMHECDVAVLHREEAVFCRRDQVQPRQSHVVIAVECKFYSVPLPLGVARAFVGLASDLRGHCRFFVFNASAESVEQYLSARAGHWERDVRPDSTIDVSRLKGALQTCLRNYVARRGT